MVIDRRGRRGGLPRRFTAGLCSALLVVQMACHTYSPMQDVAPVAGRAVALELNDRGRVLVGGQLGESVMTVEGLMVGSTDSAVTLRVSRTVMLQGSQITWNGEQVAIPRDGVRGFRTRSFSRGRTVLMAVAVVTGLALIGAALSLAVGGLGRDDPPGTCPPDCNPS